MKNSRVAVGGGGDLEFDLGEGQLARQHDLREAHVLQEARLFGVRMSVWVLAWSWIGGRSSSSRPMSCTISASTPASWSWRIRRAPASSSSSNRMVLQVTKTRA
jgi:hypothetical protein